MRKAKVTSVADLAAGNSEMCDCSTRLEGLSLSNNHLSGPIPSSLGSLANLRALTLGWNELSGTIPPALGNLANLKELYLSSNQLSGSLPTSFTQLTALEGFAFGDNAGLCSPGDTVFQKWLAAIPQRLPVRSGSSPRPRLWPGNFHCLRRQVRGSRLGRPRVYPHRGARNSSPQSTTIS